MSTPTLNHEPPMANLYAQDSWSQNAHIVATPNALRQLKDAIDRALDNQTPQTSPLSASDGDPYDLIIIPLENVATIDKLTLPYVEDPARDWRVGTIDPRAL